MIMKKAVGITVMVMLAAGGVVAQRGVPMNLEKLVRESGLIFVGRVIGNHTGERDKMDLLMTQYTFEITDSIYGAKSDTVHIKQYGGEADGKKFYPAGIPRFEVGETLLVFLYPLSKIGMTSAVGKSQGKFQIARDSTGILRAMNSMGNEGLFRNLNHPEEVADSSWIEAPEPGPLPLDRFVQTIRRMVAVLKKK